MHQIPVQCIDIADTQHAPDSCQPMDSQLLPFLSPSTPLLRPHGLRSSVSQGSFQLGIVSPDRHQMGHFFTHLCDNINLVDFLPFTTQR